LHGGCEGLLKLSSQRQLPSGAHITGPPPGTRQVARLAKYGRPAF
jgi:hypothetical protein